MRLISLSFITATFRFYSVAAEHANQPYRKMECTLFARGGDDALHFLRALQECQTVTIPKSTTLNIESRLDMTGLRDKHIVNP